MTLSREVESIRRQAADLAAGLSKTARREATIAQERATLRMLGVDGLDRSGRPLAASTVERYCGSDPGRLARGLLLPFVVATMEYDLAPRELALEVASGAIDLGLEAELLERPDRLAAAEARASKLVNSALARFDANRTAAREQRDVLGSPDEPWFGLSLVATEAESASRETRRLIGLGVDVVQVPVPASWELAEARRTAAPAETPGHKVKKRSTGTRVLQIRQLPRLDRDAVPAGSQRGLAALRRAADDAAAERGCYASLMTVTSAFAAPEQAVVAAFERIDIVAADPMREIVEDNVDPERALADHAFAHRLQARAGCRVVMGAGPLTLGADVASGVPSDAATRAGRALALQALGAELALAGGLPAERLLLGAVPDWLGGDGDPLAFLVQAWLRRALFPDHRLVVEAPRADPGTPAPAEGVWTASLVAALAGAAAGLVIGDRRAGPPEHSTAELAAASAAAAALRTSLGDGLLHGDADELARRTLRAAGQTLERFGGEGWPSVLGHAGGGELERFGHGAVVERAAAPTSGARLLDRLL